MCRLSNRHDCCAVPRELGDMAHRGILIRVQLNASSVETWTADMTMRASRSWELA
jgi:hypothetical protein